MPLTCKLRCHKDSCINKSVSGTQSLWYIHYTLIVQFDYLLSVTARRVWLPYRHIEAEIFARKRLISVISPWSSVIRDQNLWKKCLSLEKVFNQYALKYESASYLLTGNKSCQKSNLLTLAGRLTITFCMSLPKVPVVCSKSQVNWLQGFLGHKVKISHGYHVKGKTCH